MIHYLYLGRVDYDDALRLQEELVALRTAGRIGNVLLLLEHPPVLTLGRNAKRANVLASDQMLAARGVTLHEINRGGDVTYHGPGQLIGYPIFDLRSLRNAKACPPGRSARLGPVDFVRLMEEVLIRLCAEFGVPASRISGLTGVWIGLASAPDPAESSGALNGHGRGTHAVRGSRAVIANDSSGPSGPEGWSSKESVAEARGDYRNCERKIAAIGIHVARGVTSHGFAFNVTTNLDDFRLINPCGITDRPVTSLAKEVSDPATLPTLEALAHRAAHQFGAVFAEPIQPLESLAALRAQAEANPIPA